MFKNKFYNIIVIAGILIIIFDISYFIGTNKYKKLQQGPRNQTYHYSNVSPIDFERATILNINKNQEEGTVSDNTTFVFVMRNNKTKWSFIVDSGKAPQELIGRKRSDIENLFMDKGYKLESITPEKVTFVKEVDGYNYNNNKYVLGIYQDYIAIYKIDDKGKIYIEDSQDDISKVRKVNEFPKNFREILLKGSSELQFDSKQVARDYLNGCIS